MNTPAINRECLLSILSGIERVVELPHHMFNFITTKVFFTVVAPFYTPPVKKVHEGSNFFRFSALFASNYFPGYLWEKGGGGG